MNQNCNAPKYVIKPCKHECTIFKSSKPSSQRTQAGSRAIHMHKMETSKNARRNSRMRSSVKVRKMDVVLIPTELPSEFEKECLEFDDLDRYCIVFDGGETDTPPLIPPTQPCNSPPLPPGCGSRTHKKRQVLLPWKSLRISDGDLFVSDTKDPCKGLIYNQLSGNPVYIRIPRKSSLEITKLNQLSESNKMCMALQSGFLSQRQTLHRGKTKRIFSDFKYCTLGNQPNRNKPGVRTSTYHCDTMPDHDWDFLLEMMERTETALSSFVPTDCIRSLNAARKLIKFPTMAPSTGCRGHSSKMFGGIAFGANVHISCHTDSDFMYSVVSAHLREHKNQLNDRILVYFCFPRLGTAIPLRSGDLLVFNPSEPHAVSSRCRNDDLVYCMSMYLKTSVVGLNDNSLSLTTQQLDAMNSHTS